MKVIAISGKAGSGKTTLANELSIALNNCEVRKFAEPLYYLQNKTQDALHKNRKKDRNLLIKLGESLKEVYGEEVFTKTMESSLKFAKNTKTIFVIDDMRFRHELDMLYQNFDVLTVRLEAPVSILDKRVGVPANRDHISETDLDNAMFDLYIDVKQKNEMEVLNEVINNL